MGTLRLFIVLLVSTLGWASLAAQPPWDAVRRRIALAAIAFVALSGLWKIAHTVRDAAHVLSRWDYLCFYLYGRVAVIARDVYDPAIFHRLGDGLSADPEWIREILGVGFPYPPDSILVPYFLGFFRSPQAAFAPWYALLLAGFIACVALARRYVPGPWPSATLVTFAFASVWAPTLQTLDYGQTIFLVTAFTFAYALERNDWRAGAWLALAVIVKPFVLVVALVALVRAQWKTLGALVATLAVSFAASALLIGPATVAKYVTDNPVARYPDSSFLVPINISLFSALARVRHATITDISPLHQPLFAVCALAFVVATAFSIARTRNRERDDYALALTICCALVVFPQTLTFYTFLLFVPFAIVWKRAHANRVAIAAVLAVDATLVSVLDGNLGAAVLVLNWVGFAYLLWNEETRRGNRNSPAGP